MILNKTILSIKKINFKKKRFFNYFFDRAETRFFGKVSSCRPSLHDSLLRYFCGTKSSFMRHEYLFPKNFPLDNNSSLPTISPPTRSALRSRIFLCVEWLSPLEQNAATEQRNCISCIVFKARLKGEDGRARQAGKRAILGRIELEKSSICQVR